MYLEQVGWEPDKWILLTIGARRRKKQSNNSLQCLYFVAQVAAEGDALVLGGISQTPSYLEGKGKQAVQASVK